jgi:hypothetical protein
MAFTPISNRLLKNKIQAVGQGARFLKNAAYMGMGAFSKTAHRLMAALGDFFSTAW